jgi:hypothetical protein
MPTESRKPLIVISYAHADEPERPAEGEVKWLSFVTSYLRPAIKHGLADLWLDRLMPGGADWEREIDQKFRACDIFILLVSRYSLASDYIVDKEIPIIRERQANGESVHFYPLVLTPTPRVGLDVVRDKNLRPPDGKPLSDFPLNERDSQMTKVADEIQELLIANTTARRAPAEAATANRPDPGSAVNSNLQPEVERFAGNLNDDLIGGDSARWQRIQITLSGRGHDRNLSFTIQSGSKVLEAHSIAVNLELVAPLVRRALRGGDPAQSPGRVLFELLWPDALKNQSSDERPRLLILDVPSARFPWELLDDRRPWASDKQGLAPPALRVGIVRQLLLERFRKDVLPTRAKPKALIIGNPRQIGLPDLPNSETEAKTIAELLGATHDVTLLIGAAAGAEKISRLLFAEAWDIIHISGHGVSGQKLAGPDGKKRVVTGIVLGGGVVLGASALSKLPVSPEIFFVNCSYQGADPIVTDGRNLAALAANVAVELVKIGTRCVIAPGWAVADEAAVAFAKRFYMGLVWGETFGVATLQARRDAYANAEWPGDTTWAAYQCYGEIDYRLSLPEFDQSAS